MASTRSHIITVGRATAIDRVFMFAMPILLVRLLSVEDFGHYRFFWLVVMTMMTAAPLGMTRGLFYFLPRLAGPLRGGYIGNVFVFLLCSGAICAVLVAPWNNLILDKLHGGVATGAILSTFIFLWVVASLLDTLPGAEQDFEIQAKILIALSAVRFFSVAFAAAVTRSVEVVFLVLLVFALTKVVMLMWYIRRRHGRWFLAVHKPKFVEQLHYSVPLGIDGGLYGLRGYSEQWVVATLFKPAQFAVFSVAAYVQPLVEIVRGSVSNVLLPKMSKMHADGDIRGIVSLNNKGNVASAMVIFPMLAFLFAFANEVTRFLFTEAFRDATAIMQVYIVGMARLAVEVTTVLTVLSQGRYLVKISTLMLLVSVLCSFWGAQWIGLVGAALGSVVVLYLEAFFTLRRTARLVSLPVSHVQEWKSLLVFLLTSIAAAIFTKLLIMSIGLTAHILPRILIGGLLMAIMYWLLLKATGHDHVLRDMRSLRALSASK